MSHTDKDDPWWVRAKWWEPRHYCQEYGIGYRRGSYHCDLPQEPIVSINCKPWRSRTRCAWYPDFPDTQVKYRQHKRESRRLFFHGPLRMKERLATREVVKGNIDVEFPDGRGRHSVLWDLW
jgi:hypothetical protein